MLKVWGRKTPSNVQALMWCIGELGLEDKRACFGRLCKRSTYKDHDMVLYKELQVV
jgi:hypothetical protein